MRYEERSIGPDPSIVEGNKGPRVLKMVGNELPIDSAAEPNTGGGLASSPPMPSPPNPPLGSVFVNPGAPNPSANEFDWPWPSDLPAFIAFTRVNAGIGATGGRLNPDAPLVPLNPPNPGKLGAAFFGGLVLLICSSSFPLVKEFNCSSPAAPN